MGLRLFGYAARFFDGLQVSVHKVFTLAYFVAKTGDHGSRLFFERRYLKRRFRPSLAVVLFLRVYSSEV